MNDKQKKESLRKGITNLSLGISNAADALATDDLLQTLVNASYGATKAALHYLGCVQDSFGLIDRSSFSFQDWLVTFCGEREISGMSNMEAAFRAGVRKAHLHPKETIDGQVFGYWCGAVREVPDKPQGRPTGAILLPAGESLDRDEVSCLDLSVFDSIWAVMPEHSKYTYSHTCELQYDDNELLFIPVPEVLDAWPVKFRVKFGEPIGIDEISKLYGDEAASRASEERLSLTLRLSRCED